MTATLRRLGTVAGVLLVAFAVAVTAALAAGRYIVAPMQDGQYVLLVLGSDTGPPREGSALTGRADGFHLVVVTADHQHATIISFPRDTWVNVPGMGNTKINASMTLGPETAVRTAEQVSGLEVDDWIVTSFDGLINLVTAMGGVSMDVEQRLTHLWTIEPGPNLLNGTSALAYLRDRKSRPNGDLDRAEGHGRFMKAVHDQLWRENLSLGRITDLVAALDTYTESSLSTAEMLQLAGVAVRIPPANVQRVRLDARLGTVGDASVVFLTNAGQATLDDIRADGVLGELPAAP